MNSVAFQDVLEVSGFAKDLPYEVEYAKFPSGAPEMEALNAGAIDFGQVGDTPFLFAYAAAAPTRAIGVINYGPAQMELLVPGTSSATSAADLKGQRIAVNKGGGGHLFVLSLLEKAGLGPKDVQLVFLGPVDASSAFASGAVDAWAAWPPLYDPGEGEVRRSCHRRPPQDTGQTACRTITISPTSTRSARSGLCSWIISAACSRRASGR